MPSIFEELEEERKRKEREAQAEAKAAAALDRKLHGSPKEKGEAYFAANPDQQRYQGGAPDILDTAPQPMGLPPGVSLPSAPIEGEGGQGEHSLAQAGIQGPDVGQLSVTALQGLNQYPGEQVAMLGGLSDAIPFFPETWSDTLVETGNQMARNGMFGKDITAALEEKAYHGVGSGAARAAFTAPIEFLKIYGTGQLAALAKVPARVAMPLAQAALASLQHAGTSNARTGSYDLGGSAAAGLIGGLGMRSAQAVGAYNPLIRSMTSGATGGVGEWMRQLVAGEEFDSERMIEAIISESLYGLLPDTYEQNVKFRENFPQVRAEALKVAAEISKDITTPQERVAILEGAGRVMDKQLEAAELPADVKKKMVEENERAVDVELERLGNKIAEDTEMSVDIEGVLKDGGMAPPDVLDAFSEVRAGSASAEQVKKVVDYYEKAKEASEKNKFDLEVEQARETKRQEAKAKEEKRQQEQQEREQQQWEESRTDVDPVAEAAKAEEARTQSMKRAMEAVESMSPEQLGVVDMRRTRTVDEVHEKIRKVMEIANPDVTDQMIDDALGIIRSQADAEGIDPDLMVELTLGDVVAKDYASGETKGTTKFVEDGRAVVELFKGADVTTIIQEMSKVYANRFLKGERRAAIETVLGKKPGDEWTAGDYVKYGEMMQKFMSYGIAPTPQLEAAFTNAKTYIQNAYENTPKENLGHLTEAEKRTLVEMFSTPQGQSLRPDLANPGKNLESRAVVDDVVNQMVDEGWSNPETVAEWNAKADESLSASRIGTIDKIIDLQNRTGQIDAWQVVAAKKFISEEGAAVVADSMTGSADPVALGRLTKLVRSYYKAGSESARALRARRDEVLSPTERAALAANELFLLAGPKLERMYAEADALQAFAEKQGSKSKAEAAKRMREKATKEHVEIITKNAQKMAEYGYTKDAVVDILKGGDIEEMAAMMRVRNDVAGEHGMLDIANEWFLMSILSGLPTHTANVFGGMAYGAWEFGVKRLAEASIGSAAGLFGVKGQAKLSELPAVYSAVVPAIKTGWENMRIAWRSEASVLEHKIQGNTMYGLLNGTAGKAEYRSGAFKGGKGRFIRAPGRALLAGDEFLKGTFATMQVHAEANRLADIKGLEGAEKAAFVKSETSADNLQSESWLNSLKFAQKLTFQTEAADMGTMPRKAVEVINAGKDMMYSESVPAALVGAMFRLKTPFVRTPVNIFRVGLGMNPIFAGTQAAVETYRAVRSDGQGSAAKAVERSAEAAVGLGIAVAVRGLMDGDEDGPRLTGTVPRRIAKGGEAEFVHANAPSQSIRFGDKWYSYSRIEPFATVMSQMADIYAIWDMNNAYVEKGMGWGHQDVTGRAYELAKASVTDKTFLQGLSDILHASEHGKFVSAVAQTATGFMPNIIRQPMRSMDETVKDTRAYRGRGDDVNADEGYWEMYLNMTGQKMLPNAAVQEALGIKTSPAKVNVMGQEEVRGGPGFSPTTDLIWRLTMPSIVREPKGILADRVIGNWNRNNPDDPWYITSQPRTVSVKTGWQESVQYTLDREEYADLHRMTGDHIQKLLADFDPVDTSNPTKDEMKIMKWAVNAGKRSAMDSYRLSKSHRYWTERAEEEAMKRAYNSP